MKPSLSEKLIVYLTLLSGLSISAVAVYYSVIGLTAIFAAAVTPIIIMGVTLEVSKLVATVWLKQNWEFAPRLIKGYLIVAVTVLMLITSMGIFGFLSKAHLDQSVPTGNVVDQVALIDEKIKTQRENIDVARKALKQMDESVDQIMARTDDERGADKAAALRRSQQRERATLQKDIATAQSTIARLNDERAPVAKELRKVEAEVGPIKYIANFFYGETDQNVLEKAVTWVIIIIVFVFDPLAVVLLLAAQTSFQQFKQRELEYNKNQDQLLVKENQNSNTIEEVKESLSIKEDNNDSKDLLKKYPYLHKGFKYPKLWKKEKPIVAAPEEVKEEVKEQTQQWSSATITVNKSDDQLFIQNEEQKESNLWSTTTENVINSEDYVKAVENKREEEIHRYAELVRSKQLQMSDVPEEYQPIVKSLV